MTGDIHSHEELNKSDQLRNDETSKVQRKVKPRRSKRGRVSKDFGLDFMACNIEEEPLSYKAVMESSKAPY